MKNKLISLFSGAIMVAGTILLGPIATKAAPFNAADKNPNVVAFYPTGDHGIADEPGILHNGIDIVMLNGNSGNLNQWFYGTSSETTGLEGDHTIWRVAKNDNIPNGWTLIQNAYPDWGTYLQPGVDYLVKTNDFRANGHTTP